MISQLWSLSLFSVYFSLYVCLLVFLFVSLFICLCLLCYLLFLATFHLEWTGSGAPLLSVTIAFWMSTHIIFHILEMSLLYTVCGKWLIACICHPLQSISVSNVLCMCFMSVCYLVKCKACINYIFFLVLWSMWWICTFIKEQEGRWNMIGHCT